MGTRHLIAVYSSGELKVAQYGQWDGYPDGQGIGVLRFIRDSNLFNFRRNVAECSFYTEEELDKLCEVGGPVPTELSRDTGSSILYMIRDNPYKLKNSIDFAADSLFCEWAWVIDLDANVFEAYRGFNTDGPGEGRFKDMKSTKDHAGGYRYYPVTLVKSWSLDDLPNDEEFLKAFRDPDEIVKSWVLSETSGTPYSTKIIGVFGQEELANEKRDSLQKEKPHSIFNINEFEIEGFER